MISLSLLSLVGRTRSWGRFLFITRQRGRVCCCSSVITCMISIYKGCVLGQWDCYNILFCFIASKTFILLKTYRYLCIIKNRKAAVSKICELFELHYVWLYTFVCLANFQFLKVLQYSLCQLFSSIQWNNLYHCCCHMTWKKSNYLHI